MGQDLAQLRNKLIALKREFNNELEMIATEMANNAKALSNRNIVDHGVEGAAYSNVVYSTFFLEGKELNAKGKTFIKSKKKKKQLTNWREFREAQGLQGDHVDLTYTGDMWSHIGVVRIVTVEDGKVVAMLGGTTQTSADKMGWNEDRYSAFIENNLNPDDAKFIKTVANRKADEIIKRLKVIP